MKDRDALLTFYDFPAEHWKHIRTTNPIESVFATVPLVILRCNALPGKDRDHVRQAEGLAACGDPTRQMPKAFLAAIITYWL